MAAAISAPAIKTNLELPNIVLFGGFSNSGKTTFCTPILEELGYQILSSSQLHHQFCDRLIKNVFGVPEFDSYDRALYIKGVSSIHSQSSTSKVLNQSTTPICIDSRKLLIDIAEKALVPTLTRGVYVNAIADLILKSPNKKYAVEIFNAEEMSILRDRLKNFLASRAYIFNLRRDTENPQVDGRTLIPLARDIQNNGTREELKQKIIDFLEL